MQSVLLFLFVLITIVRADDFKIKVIGASWGRTGTSSLKAALEILGYRVYHMKEIVEDNFKPVPLWEKLYGLPKNAREERHEVLRQLLEGYNATTDMPSAHFFEDQLEMFPNAKVILTLRDFEGWLKSALNTVANFSPENDNVPFGIKLYRNLFPLGIMYRDIFSVLISPIPKVGTDKEIVHKAYDAWIDHVRKTVTKPGQLLEIKIGKDSWKPLCEFLEIDEDKCPKGAFPHVNEEAEIRRVILIQSIIGYTWTAFLIAIISYLAWFLFLKNPSQKSIEKSE